MNRPDHVRQIAPQVADELSQMWKRINSLESTTGLVNVRVNANIQVMAYAMEDIAPLDQWAVTRRPGNSSYPWQARYVDDRGTPWLAVLGQKEKENYFGGPI